MQELKYTVTICGPSLEGILNFILSQAHFINMAELLK